MHDEGTGFALFGLTLFAVAMWLIGVVVGALWDESAQREKFIIYCTSKGDTYKNCDEIFNGKEPEVK